MNQQREDVVASTIPGCDVATMTSSIMTWAGARPHGNVGV